MTPEPTAHAQFVAYVAAALCLAAYFGTRSDRRGLVFLLSFWIMAAPVIDLQFYFDPAWLPFGFSFTRVLLVLLLGILVIDTMGFGVATSAARLRPRFERPILIYVLLVFVAVLVNVSTLDLKRIIGIPLEPITFAVIYFVAKRHLTQRDVGVLLRVIVVMAAINAIVALIQLGASPMFLRIEVPRLAFGSTYRSFGVFRSEYVMGQFQLLSLVVSVTVLRGKWYRLPLVGLIALSVFTTFHRLDILVLLTISVIYMRFYAPKRANVAVFAIGLLVLLAAVPAYSVLRSFGEHSKLVEQRLLANTVTGRFEQYGIVIPFIVRHPLGVASQENPSYQRLMISHGMTKSMHTPSGDVYEVGLDVHNGFLSVGVRYGIAGTFVFVLLLWRMFKYFNAAIGRRGSPDVIPLFAVLIWAMVNISNGLVNFRDEPVLLVALLAGGFVGLRSRAEASAESASHDVPQRHCVAYRRRSRALEGRATY